jgi:hypothetical protein
VSFDYLVNLRKLKKNLFEGWAGVMKRGVLINEKPNQRERKKVWDTLGVAQVTGSRVQSVLREGLVQTLQVGEHVNTGHCTSQRRDLKSCYRSLMTDLYALECMELVPTSGNLRAGSSPPFFE